MADMDGRAVLITGASRGIGAAAARTFAEVGARVALVARSGDEIARLAGEIGDRAVAIPCDVSRFWEMEAAVAAARESLGRLDAVILNAGVIEPIAPMAEADPVAWAGLIETNLTGVFHGLRAAMPVMIAAGGGTIVVISSGAAHRPLEGWSAYCASKAGAAMLVRSADLEGREAGLRVMGLSPGTVATGMQETIRASGINRVSRLDWSDHIPPDWPARALVWMCGPEADGYRGGEVSLRDEEVRRQIGL